MQKRSLFLGTVAGVLLAVPAIVAGREPWLAPVGGGSPDAPVFLGGSGRTVPRGALEVVRASGPASLTAADGTVIPLGSAVGTLVSPIDGAVLTGCCEVVAPGEVSFHLPEGSRARVRTTPEGGLVLEAASGTVFAQNGDVTLSVAEGGDVGATVSGKFQDVAGDGQAGRQGRWVTWRSGRGTRTLAPAQLREEEYKEVEGDCDPVSPSRDDRGKGKKKD